MNLPWEDVRLFLAIAETGSLTAAARRLRIAQPTVSRRLTELEALLREPVFVRQASGVRLTPLGERLLGPARRMAEGAAEVDRAADGADTLPRGQVRITAPPGVAFDFVAPFAAELRHELPGVRLEVISTTEYLDLSRREADLAIRMQRPSQRDQVCLASLEFENRPFVSPRYLASLAPGYTAADIDWIAWAPPLESLPPNPQLAALIPGFLPRFASDDFLVQLRAAMAGVGAMFLGDLDHSLALSKGLVPLELDIGRAPGALHLVAARAALEIPRVKAVADRLARALEDAAPRAGRPARDLVPRV